MCCAFKRFWTSEKEMIVKWKYIPLPENYFRMFHTNTGSIGNEWECIFKCVCKYNKSAISVCFAHATALNIGWVSDFSHPSLSLSLSTIYILTIFTLIFEQDSFLTSLEIMSEREFFFWAKENFWERKNLKTY